MGRERWWRPCQCLQALTCCVGVLLPGWLAGMAVQGGAHHVQLDLENHRGKVTEWLQNEPVQGEIRRQFKKFLRTFKDDNGDRLYVRVIENMVLGEWQRAARGWGAVVVSAAECSAPQQGPSPRDSLLHVTQCERTPACHTV